MDANDTAKMRTLYGPWGMQEIQRYLAVNRDTLNNWRRSTAAAFPQERTISGNPYWWADEIDDWATETRHIPAFRIMLSDGSEEVGGEPAWLLVDEKDSAIDAIPYRDGDTIHDGITRMWERGLLPDVALGQIDTVSNPYAWQIEPYRWHLAQIRIPRTAGEWAEALDALMKATGMTAEGVVSNAYATGSICHVPVDPEHEEADDERGVLASGEWAVRYNEQAGYWSAV